MKKTTFIPTKAGLLFAALFTLILSGCQTKDAASNNPVLTIAGGQVQGVATDSPGVIVYKGIPYAAPPVGDLRWKEPQPVAAWEGIKIADTYGPAAPQSDKVPGGPGGDSLGRVDYVKEFFQAGNPVRSEDCLYLNVWTPSPGQTTAKLPVALWIHGGAFTQGFAYEPEFDGEAFARQGVILVTINYRLGVFGFLTHPLLTAESPHHVSGNYGILDQIAALKWVRENISQFGGDPNNITIFGQSAGAFSIQCLALSPLSRNNISKAIIQSGGGLGRAAGATLADAEPLAQAAFEDAGITTLEAMRALSYEDILKRFSEWSAKEKKRVPTSTVIDGYVLPTNFTAAVQSGQIAHVPYMLGGTKDDGAFAKVGQGHYDFSLELVKQGLKPAYIYDFRRELPGDNAGAFHSSELWYVFGTVDRCWRPMTDGDRELSNRMVAYWTNFIKTGAPNGTGLPQWQPYTEQTPFVMNLDITQ